MPGAGHLLPSDPERLDERQMRLGTDEPLFRLIYSLKQVRIIEPHGEGTVAGGLLRVLERQRPFELTPGSVGVDLNGRPVLRYRIDAPRAESLELGRSIRQLHHTLERDTRILGILQIH